MCAFLTVAQHPVVEGDMQMGEAHAPSGGVGGWGVGWGCFTTFTNCWWDYFAQVSDLAVAAGGAICSLVCAILEKKGANFA